MNEDNLPKRDNIWRQTADQVAGVFPYFLVAYLIFLVISLFYDSLDKYLNLAGFTTAIIFLGVITFFSRYFQSGILSFFWSRIRLLWGLLLNYKYKIALIIIFTLLCAWGGASITELLV
ncbi:MAG: hypothetical protein WCO03_02785, partial [bacterium]